MGLKIALGIKSIHKKNIIHRDIKPQNILLDADNNPKICDFGCSIKRNIISKIKGIKGTLQYMAP